MELIASNSSALLDLSIQQVSIQTHRYPFIFARLQQPTSFRYPLLPKAVPFSMSASSTSSSLHVWDKITYWGIALPRNSFNRRAVVSSRRIRMDSRLRLERNGLVATQTDSGLNEMRTPKFDRHKGRHLTAGSHLSLKFSPESFNFKHFPTKSYD